MKCDIINKFRNAEYLGEGAYRKAYTFGKNNECIVKLPHNESDRKHNLTEALTWKYIKKMPNVRKYFVPVTSFDNDGKWLVMPKVRSLELSNSERTKIQSNVMELIRKEGIWCDDIHIFNVGLDKSNKPVILDYGFGCREASESDRVVQPITKTIWDNDDGYDFSGLDFFGKH